MEKAFSTSWIRSTQRRKQRKYREQAPLHTRRKFLSANLARPLRTLHAMRSLPLRVGDEVKVLRGQFKGTAAKVENINLTRLQVQLEKVTVTKADGTTTPFLFSPSNVQITKITTDARRLKKQAADTADKKTTKSTAKPAAKKTAKKTTKKVSKKTTKKATKKAASSAKTEKKE